jgi:hypothetical protein
MFYLLGHSISLVPFHSKRKLSRRINVTDQKKIKTYLVLHVKCLIFFSPRFRPNLDRLNRLHESPQYQISQKSVQWGSQLMHADRRTDMTEVTVPFSRLMQRHPTFRPKYLQNFGPNIFKSSVQISSNFRSNIFKISV